MTARTQNRTRYRNILSPVIPSAATSLSAQSFIRPAIATHAPKTANAKALRTRTQNSSGALAREMRCPFRFKVIVPDATAGTDIQPPRNANIEPVFILTMGSAAAHRVLIDDLVIGLFDGTYRCCPHLNV